MKWYQKTSSAVVDELGSSEDHGLSENEAYSRQIKHGKNTLSAKPGRGLVSVFLSQFKDILILILIVSASISLALSFIENTSKTEPMLIYLIVIAIVLVGFLNEYKAEKTLEALKKLVSLKVKVRRGGQTSEINAEDLVPGDIVLLEEGQKIPADIRIIKAYDLKINESSLTGESIATIKNEKTINGTADLGDRLNMCFAGTYISAGSGVGVVVEIGNATELGKIANMVSAIEAEQTPMQKKLDDLGKKLGLFIIVICAVVFAVVFLFVDEALDKNMAARIIFAFTAAVALAVAAIPEGLAFVVRISLALGARRMAKKNALVRRLSSVEALGSTDVICSDKTGTLTKGEMTVRRLFAAGNEYDVAGNGYDISGEIKDIHNRDDKSLRMLLTIGALCNNSGFSSSGIIGDPTEAALLVSAQKLQIHYQDIQDDKKKISEAPFSSERKFMSTLHKNGSRYMLAQKGAVEVTLSLCEKILVENGKIRNITEKDKKLIIEKTSHYAGKAMRVLAFSMREFDEKPSKLHTVENGLVFVGLQAMMDPPRSEVVDVISRVQNESGIRVVMITGDFLDTATAVAKEIGIKGEAITGAELDVLDEDEFQNLVERIGIYARVNPSHKLRIVQALKRAGHQVAMTGDGVNDSPAIKAADIGIAMGITGTDAAKEAADLVLLDDQFLTIISAIEEGRGIFDNMRKFVNFLISCNIAEVLVILIGIIVFDNLLLTAAQLLFINILTDGLPAIALGSDPAQDDVLSSKPEKYQQKLINLRVWVEIFTFGTLMTAALLAHYWYNYSRETKLSAISAVFAAMVIYEMVRLIDIRTDYRIRWFSNPWLTIAIVGALVLHFSVLFIPKLSSIFSVQPLAVHDWIIMVIGSLVLFASMKLLNRVFNLAGPEN